MSGAYHRRVKVLSIIHHPFSLWHAPEWLKPRLEREFPQLDITLHDNYENVERKIAEAEIFLGWSLRGHQVRAAQKLRWIHSTAAAVHQLMSPELVARDIVVTNARSVHGPVVAEHAIALMLAMAKRLHSCFGYQRQKRWAQDEIWRMRPQEIAGATVAVVGLGCIGEAVARSAGAMGMHVIAVREHPERGRRAAHELFGLTELDDVLSRSDFVVLAVPVTPRTQRLMTAERMARMKSGSCLINVARGSLVDESALVQALTSGNLGGAALDVFEEEPLPAASDLWKLPNVVITPHTAGLTDRMWERQYELLSDNIRRYLGGHSLRNQVDMHSGY